MESSRHLSVSCILCFVLGMSSGDVLVTMGVNDMLERSNESAKEQENSDSTHHFYLSTESLSVDEEFTPTDREQSGSNFTSSQLPVIMTSPTSGYLTSGVCNRLMSETCKMDAWYTVWIDLDQVTLLSFPLFELRWAWFTDHKGFVKLTAVHRNGTMNTEWRHRSPQVILPHLYYSSMMVKVYVPPEDSLHGGFKMIFSIHNVSQKPPQIRKGVFNCSVPFYHSFQGHFHCNLKPECPGGEDEGPHCPFSNEACGGDVAVGNKCYHSYSAQQTLRWTHARKMCQSKGGDLATMKTPKEWDAFLLMVNTLHLLERMYVGMHSFHPSMARIYKRSFVWVDGVVNYSYGTRPRSINTFFKRVCLFYDPTIGLRFKYWLNYVSCQTTTLTNFVCETQAKNETSVSPVSIATLLVNSTLHNTSLSLARCPDGHVTHLFLTCDPRSHCGADRYLPKCSTSGDRAGDNGVIGMFVCDDGAMTVPYSFVCDSREDCSDGSDESPCEPWQSCLEFRCRNGQCIYKSEQCNVAVDCWDGSDEECIHFISLFNITFRVPPPALLTFDGSGNVTYTVMSNCERYCPETHFCCPEGYCLPVFCRCNGLADCYGKEDEANCEEFHCPGYYRCLNSTVCVHPQHVCDGFDQCPMQDDEWLCNIRCPSSCSCQGVAFRCSLPVPYTFMPSHLRYFDAEGSGMGPANVTGLRALVWLRMARCGLTRVTEMDLPNLRTLDLSFNQLASLNTDVFQPLLSLKLLDLSHNPIEHVFSTRKMVTQTRLHTVNLSSILWKTFDGTVLASFPRIRVLDLSHSSLTEISAEGFHALPNLAQVHLRGCKIQDYPSDVFRHLHKLTTVQADEYRLCCKVFLPPGFDRGMCSAPMNEISSCDDLLRSDTFRAFLWLFSVLSVVGNVGCLVTRLFLLKSKSPSTFSVFVTNLSIADLLMGIYLAMVGTADHMYRGQYVWFENKWKPSLPCQLAGFLSLLSSETSAFIICLITLDRFLVLSSPFSDVRFRRRSARAACLLAWLLGLCLAAVPLLPATTEWQFYSQTGICIPLPITRRSFKGRDYAFGVIILFNLALFLLIATGQAMIYWTIRTTSMSQSSTRKTEDLTVARRLLSVVVSDFLCWFPIGLLGVMAANGTPVPGEVNVGMAIFVLPLNAALNPFLYTFNALMDRLRRREEEQLLKQLEARAVASLYGEPGA